MESLIYKHYSNGVFANTEIRKLLKRHELFNEYPSLHGKVDKFINDCDLESYQLDDIYAFNKSKRSDKIHFLLGELDDEKIEVLKITSSRNSIFVDFSFYQNTEGIEIRYNYFDENTNEQKEGVLIDTREFLNKINNKIQRNLVTFDIVLSKAKNNSLWINCKDKHKTQFEKILKSVYKNKQLKITDFDIAPYYTYYLTVSLYMKEVNNIMEIHFSMDCELPKYKVYKFKKLSDDRGYESEKYYNFENAYADLRKKLK